MGAVLGDVGIEGEVVGVRRVPTREAARDDHAAAREAQLTAREAGRSAHSGRPQERRAGVDAVVDHAHLHALAGGRAVGTPERNGSDERWDRVRLGAIGRDGVDGGDARQALDAAQLGRRQPQRDRIQHDAVAPLDGGPGHVGAEARGEGVLDPRQAGEVEPRSERGGIQPPDAADAHELSLRRCDERQRRRREAHDDLDSGRLRLRERRQREGNCSDAEPETRSRSVRAPGAPGHVARTRSAAMRAASVGLTPTGMPRASSASFLPCAVPEEPEMIAPA